MFAIFELTSTKACILDFAAKTHRFAQCPLTSTLVSYQNIDEKNCSSVLKSSTYDVSDNLAVSNLLEIMMEIHLKAYSRTIIDAVNSGLSKTISSIIETSAMIGGTILNLLRRKLHRYWEGTACLYEFFPR